MELKNVSYLSGRFYPLLASQKHRGLQAYGFWKSLFFDVCGSGTIKVEVNHKTYYVNKASCFKLLKPSQSVNLDKSSRDYVDFIHKDSDTIIREVQTVIDMISREKTLENNINTQRQAIALLEKSDAFLEEKDKVSQLTAENATLEAWTDELKKVSDQLKKL